MLTHPCIQGMYWVLTHPMGGYAWLTGCSNTPISDALTSKLSMCITGTMYVCTGLGLSIPETSVQLAGWLGGRGSRGRSLTHSLTHSLTLRSHTGHRPSQCSVVVTV